jgi:hypothetical protein
LYKIKNDYAVTRTPKQFWEQFALYDKKWLVENELPKSNIPKGLRDMMKDLF